MTTWQYIKLVCYLGWCSVAKASGKKARAGSDEKGFDGEASQRVYLRESAEDGLEAAPQKVSCPHGWDKCETHWHDTTLPSHLRWPEHGYEG